MARKTTKEVDGWECPFTKCWGCGNEDDLDWVEGFGFGKRCNCSKNPKFVEASKKMSMLEIMRRVKRLYR